MNNESTSYIKECSIVSYTYVVIDKYPSRHYALHQVITSAAYCLLIIPVVILNGITVLTIFKSHQLIEKVSQFPVFIQSMADLFVGFLTLPLFAYLNFNEVFGSLNCVQNFVLSSIAFIPWGLSLAALCALTFERYMGVVYPFIHLNYVTKKIFLIYSCCVLLVTVIISSLAQISATFYYAFCGIYAIFPMLLHTFCYSRIFCLTRKRFQEKSNHGANSSSPETPTSNNMRKRYSLKELKLAKSCALIVVTFYVCCVPGEFLNIYYLEKDFITYRVVISWYAAVLGVNATLNSIIFFWTRPILRKEAFKVLKGTCHSN